MEHALVILDSEMTGWICNAKLALTAAAHVIPPEIALHAHQQGNNFPINTFSSKHIPIYPC